VNTDKSAGEHTVQFNATGWASGIYFYEVEAGVFDGGGGISEN
jgi:hypothetical protein